MFFSQGKDLVERMTREAFQRANVARKGEARRLLDYYHGAQLPYVEEFWRNKNPETHAELEKATVNIVAKIVNALAQVYRDPPARLIEGGLASDNALLADVAEGCALDARLKQASRYCKLLGTVLLRPVWRNNRLDLDVLTPDVVDVQVGDSPEDLEAVLVTRHGDGAGDATFSLWTSDVFKRLDHRGRVLEEMPNPYGRIPFVACWNMLPGGEFWQAVDDGLASVQDAVNTRLVAFLRVMEMQAFSVAVAKGVSAARERDLHIGPGYCVELDTEGDFHFERQDAPLQDHLAAIDRLIKWAAMARGISSAYVSVDVTDASGVSKAMDSMELAETRQDDAVLWRVYEKKLFEVMRAVWNVHNPGRRFSEAGWLRVDFADPRPTMTPMEQAQLWDKWRELGLVTEVDLVMERNQDISSRKEAEALLVRMGEERARLRDPSLDDLTMLHKAGAIPLDVFLQLLQERGWLPPSVDVAAIVAAKEERAAQVAASMSGMDRAAQELEEEEDAA